MKVTSFEISKKLKELGVDLTTNIGWSDKDLPSYYGVPGTPAYGFVDISDTLHSEYILFCCETGFESEDGYKAYILEDILAILKNRGRVNIYISKNLHGISFNNEKNYYMQENETLADTAARALIKLIDDKIITVDEVNK